MFKEFVVWLDLEANWKPVFVFLAIELIVLTCIGVVTMDTPSYELIKESELIELIEDEQLEYKQLTVPTAPVEKKATPSIRPTGPVMPAKVESVPTDELIAALIMVESSGNDHAKGDVRKGSFRAYGCLQIWETYVIDVNRVYRTNYEHMDMFDRLMAVDTCKLYLTHYGKRYSRLTGKEPTMEVFARIHNGGPNGWKRASSVPYWNRVNEVLNPLLKLPNG